VSTFRSENLQNKTKRGGKPTPPTKERAPQDHKKPSHREQHNEIGKVGGVFSKEIKKKSQKALEIKDQKKTGGKEI